MKRVRTLGGAVVVVLSLAACLGVSFAAAGPAKFATPKYPAIVGGTPIVTESQAYQALWTTSGGIEWSCKPGQFAVEISKPSDLINPSMLDYSCSNAPAGPLTVEMQGCAFVFHVADKIEAGKYNGRIDIGNAPGETCSKGIKLTRSASHNNCYWTVLPTTGQKGATFEAVKGEPSKVNVTVNQGFSATTSSQSLCYGTSLSYRGTWQLDGAEDLGGSKGKEFNLSIQEVGEHFEASSYPSPFAVEQYDPFEEEAPTLKTSGGSTLRCEGKTFEGTLTSASSTLTSQAGYSGCTDTVGASKLPAEISMNSCSYTFHLLSTESPFAATSDIGCSKEGDAIEATIYESKAKQEAHTSLCVLRIAPQSGLTGVTFKDYGYPGSMTATLALEKVAVSRTGSLLCGAKSQTATYGGQIGFPSGMWVG